jgi:pyruvate,water dikinase
LPTALGPDAVLVLPSLDVALVPLVWLGVAAVCESSGALSPGADAVRELGIPTVTSLTEAVLGLDPDARLRVDGDRGTVQRVEPKGGGAA